MEFTLLGPVESRLDHATTIALPGTKMSTVLAALLLAEGGVVPDEKIADLLWRWWPPDTRTAQIYTHISRLRKVFGKRIEIVRHPHGYALPQGDWTVDLLRFRQLNDRGLAALENERHAEAVSQFRAALSLWRGEALSNTTTFMRELEAPRLAEYRVATTENYAEAALALGDHRQLVPELLDLVARFPMYERLRAQLMTALHRSGRPGDAVQVYQEGQRILAEELGVDPGLLLGRTYRALLNGELDSDVVVLPDFLRARPKRRAVGREAGRAAESADVR
ncbi:AfsR/SARP family transcriptional regulator [Micromonospora sp. NPDC005215]|uniref:AfsR/SARP family transcriptional regulator n=1 Tax=Micromonospora sp. NPDC005215 TaxID=3157024 RepID=UPI0033B9B741